MQTTDVSPFVVEYFDDGAIVLATADGRMLQVNATGATILKLTEAGRTEAEIATELYHAYGIETEEAEWAVTQMRRQLQAAGAPLDALRLGAAPRADGKRVADKGDGR